MVEPVTPMADGPKPIVKPVVAAVVKSFPPAFRSGGPGRSVSALVETLGNRLDFRVFTSIDDNGHDLRADGIDVGQWQRREGAEAFTVEPTVGASIGLVRELRALQPDVLYLNSFFNPVFSIAPLLARKVRLLKPPRTIIAPRGEFSPGALSLKSHKKRRFLRLFKGLRLGSGVIWHATSELEADLIRQTIGNVDVELAPVMRTLEAVADPDGDGRDHDRLELVLLSKIDRMKNIETALDAVAMARSDVHLTIAGPVKEPVYWEACLRQIDELGLAERVTYHGPVEPDAVSHFLRGFDGFLLPTRGENFGHVILEALAAGLPTIISDTTQWNRLEAQGAGWVCGVDDAAGFAAAVDRLGSASDDERRAMGAAAAQVARAYMDDRDTLASNAALFGLTDGAQSAVQVALVHYAFPVTTQTFHHRRARVMLERGALQSIHFVNDADGEVEQRAEAILPLAQAVPRSALPGALFSLANPEVRRLLVAGLGATTNDNGEGGRLGFLWQALHGVAVGRGLRAGTATHVHAPFATAPATVAVFAAVVSGRALSIEVHSPISATKNPGLLAWKLQQATTVAVISDYTAGLVRNLCPTVEPVVVHCGLDLDEPPGDDSADTAEGDDIVAIGSLGPKKGHDVLIEASALLVERVPHTVAIVGGGPLHDELQELIEAVGAPVRLLGQLSPEETATIRGTARVGALAAVRTDDGDEDGVPVALMEFMAAGVPVVSTDVAGIAELLDDGQAGAVVPASDPAAFADALETALTDGTWRDRVAAAGRCRIASSFDNQVETKKLLRHLDESVAYNEELAGTRSRD